MACAFPSNGQAAANRNAFYPQGFKKSYIYGWVAEVNCCRQVHQPATEKLKFTEEVAQKYNFSYDLWHLNCIGTPSRADLS